MNAPRRTETVRRMDRLPRWMDNVPLPEPHLAGLAAAGVLQHARPWRLPGGRRSRRLVGIPLLAAGSGLVVASVREAREVRLSRPGRLVTSGPYAVSRNPMYLGWSLLTLGVGVLSGSTWVVAVSPAVAAWMHAVVGREERTLDTRFGEEFRRYRRAVPRYLARRG
jgi:protein-S-isoprenylcysteine O-methyltransferase Ste14